MKHLPPLFDDRSVVEQIIAAIVVPLIFGIITGLALGFHAILYWVLAGPLRSAAASSAAWSTAGRRMGSCAARIGGLIFGSFTLIGLEILDTDPKTYLSEPQVGLVFATTLFGCILGALGGQYRLRREREAEAGAATA